MLIKRKKKKDLSYVIEHENLEKHKVSERKICGIYFLYNSGQLIYIGKSLDILGRINQHTKTKKFDRYSFEEVPKSELAQVEKACIEYYLPKLNTALNPIANTNRIKIDFELKENHAAYKTGTIYMNIGGIIIKTRVSSSKSKGGFFNYRFLDYRGRFTNSNRSANIKGFNFEIFYKEKFYTFKALGNYEWQLVETL